MLVTVDSLQVRGILQTVRKLKDTGTLVHFLKVWKEGHLYDFNGQVK